MYPLEGKSAADVANATRTLQRDIVGCVECFRTHSCAEFVNALFASLCIEETIRHDHTGGVSSKHNDVVERGLGLIQGGGMAACFEASRLFSGYLPSLDRYSVEAAIYVKYCTNTTTATTTNAHITSTYGALLWKLPPPNTLTIILA